MGQCMVTKFITKKPIIYNGERTVSAINGVAGNGQLCKRMKLNHYFTTCTKTNSEWIEDFKLRPEKYKTSVRKYTDKAL